MTTDAHTTRRLVEEIVRTGLMITGLLEDLLDEMPEDAFPGESHVEVLFEMLAGTIEPATAAAGDDIVLELIALVGAMSDRVLDDLSAAALLARAQERGV